MYDLFSKKKKVQIAYWIGKHVEKVFFYFFLEQDPFV